MKNRSARVTANALAVFALLFATASAASTPMPTCPVPSGLGSERQESAARACSDELRRESAEYREDVARGDDSCAYIDQLRAKAVTMTLYRDAYRVEAERRWVRAVRAHLDAIERVVAAAAAWTDAFFADAETPDGAEVPRRALADARAAAEAIACYDAEMSRKASAIVDEMEVEVRKRIAAETACRRTPSCLAKRVEEELCSAVADRRDALQAIAMESHRPGVADLQQLRDLGERVRSDDRAIRQRRFSYARLARRAFRETVCRP